MAEMSLNLFHTHGQRVRDSYGFALRPQHIQRYQEYVDIYKEEEDERSDRWKFFLEQLPEKSDQSCTSEDEEACRQRFEAEITEFIVSEKAAEWNRFGQSTSYSDGPIEFAPENKVQFPVEFEKKVEEPSEQLQSKVRKIGTWSWIRPSLCAIQKTMSLRVKDKKYMKDNLKTTPANHLPSIEETRSSGGDSDECIGKEEGDVDKSVDGNRNESPYKNTADDEAPEPLFPWIEELELLVHGGVPKDLRGEVWQAFVGVKARRIESYYEQLLVDKTNAEESKEHHNATSARRKWERQIEKVIRCMRLGLCRSIF